VEEWISRLTLIVGLEMKPDTCLRSSLKRTTKGVTEDRTDLGRRRGEGRPLTFTLYLQPISRALMGGCSGR
jgi:hypothetical protein